MPLILHIYVEVVTGGARNSPMCLSKELALLFVPCNVRILKRPNNIWPKPLDAPTIKAEQEYVGQ